MKSKKQLVKLKEKVSSELSKQSLKDRLSSATISEDWKKVRNISGIIFTITSLISAAPLSIPANILIWINYATLVSGVIAGRAQLNKSKKQ